MTDADDYWARMVEKHPKECAGFERWRDYLNLANWGHGLPAFDRIKTATWDVREFRRVFDQRGTDYEIEALAVRIAADAFASQILAAADEQQDTATVAWVVAGLRCNRRPFCTGCKSCATITAPMREN